MQSLESLISELTAALGESSKRSSSSSVALSSKAEGLKALNSLIQEFEAVRANCVPALISQQKKTHGTAKKSESVPTPNPNSAQPTELNINCLDLRVGVITQVEKHPKADKLYCEQIDGDTFTIIMRFI